MTRTISKAVVLAGCALGVAAASSPAIGAEPLSEGETYTVDPDTTVSANADRSESRSPWSAHAGIGFTLSPSALLLSTGLEYEATRHVSAGPLVQFAVDDDVFIVAPTANTRYRFDLSQVDNDFLRRVEPFVQGGLGFAYVEKDRPGRNAHDTSFLVNGGFGFEYAIDDSVSVGNSVLFNGFPIDEAAGEDFFFSWQFLTARVRF